MSNNDIHDRWTKEREREREKHTDIVQHRVPLRLRKLLTRILQIIATMVAMTTTNTDIVTLNDVTSCE